MKNPTIKEETEKQLESIFGGNGSNGKAAKPNERRATSWTETSLREIAERKAVPKKKKKAKKRASPLTYKEIPIHLFPEHPKAPYMELDWKYAGETHVGYTIHFISEFKAYLRGEKRLSNSLAESVYMALMADAIINLDDKPLNPQNSLDREVNDTLARAGISPQSSVQELALHVLSKCTLEEVVERYREKVENWNTEAVQNNMYRCAHAMARAFREKPALHSMFTKSFRFYQNRKHKKS